MNVSIILEWENVILSGENRTRSSLPDLCQQMRELAERRDFRFEVLLVYSTAEFTRDQIDMTIKQGFADIGTGMEVRPVAFDDGAYWEKKNAGADSATGDFLVFFDSDTAPEPGWLAALLAPFDSDDVHAVAGETYPELDGYYSRAMALFWLFPLRSDRRDLAPSTVAYGNNSAFRRTTFLKYRYRSQEQFRSGASDLLQRMAADGIVTYMQPTARCGHPPPNGLAHFVRRAACEGHDNVMLLRRTVGRAPWRQSYWTLRQRTAGDLLAIRRGYQKVGLSPVGAFGAALLAMAYSCCILLGEALTRIDPAIVRRHLRV